MMAFWGDNYTARVWPRLPGLPRNIPAHFGLLPWSLPLEVLASPQRCSLLSLFFMSCVMVSAYTGSRMSAPNVFATDEKIGSLLDQSITRHYLSTLTDQGGKVCAEYVWIGGTMADMRSKSRTLDKLPTKPEVSLPLTAWSNQIACCQWGAAWCCACSSAVRRLVRGCVTACKACSAAVTVKRSAARRHAWSCGCAILHSLPGA